MSKTELSKRLMRIAINAKKGSRLADIGSDHAYLPIYMMEENWIDYALAGEVALGPYQSAQNNIVDHQLGNQIDVRLADGLAAIKEDDCIDTLVIAGMGGRLIVQILEEGHERLKKIPYLILQPNNQEDYLRQWLSDHGFSICAEELIEEHGKFYELLSVEPGQKVLSKEECRFGPFLMREKSSLFIKRWEKEKKKLLAAYHRIPDSHVKQKQEIKNKIKKIEEISDESK